MVSRSTGGTPARFKTLRPLDALETISLVLSFHFRETRIVYFNDNFNGLPKWDDDEIYFNSAHEPGYEIPSRANTTRKDIRYVTPEHLSDMWLSTLESGEVQLRSVTEIATKSRSCVWTAKPYPLWFSCRHKLKLSGIVWTPIQYVTDSTFEIGQAQLNELTLLMCERTEPALSVMAFVPA